MSSPLGQDPRAWVSIFEDDFTGPMTAVDAADGYWRLSPGGPVWRVWYMESSQWQQSNLHLNNPDRGQCWYDERGVTVANGILSLSALPTPTNGMPYIGGMIQSDLHFAATYGYVEARIKQPAVDHSWPAFWMYSALTGRTCEFDIMENYGTGQAGQYSLSTWRNNTGGAAGTFFGHAVPTTTTDWHVYGAAWSPDALVFYLDGVEVARDTNPSDIPAEPMLVLFDIQVETGAVAANFPAAMQVDWVRFYKPATEPVAYLGDKLVNSILIGGDPATIG